MAETESAYPIPALVSILRCPDYGLQHLKQKVNETIQFLRFNPDCLKGKKVLLKPNLLSPTQPEKAVTTHPGIVRAVAELALEAGARVMVGDSPALGNIDKCLNECGIKSMLGGLEIEYAKFNQPIAVKTFAGSIRKEFVIGREAVDCDMIINLPKLKTHFQMGMTGAAKNMFGLMLGPSKGRMHVETGRDRHLFARTLVELCYLKKPVLTVVDGITAMDGNGPGGGDPFPLNLIIGGYDPIAIDRVIAEIVGINEDNIPIFKAAGAVQRGIHDLKDIGIVGEKIADVSVSHFRPAVKGRPLTQVPNFLVRPIKDLISYRPYVDRKKCTVCQECVNTCPLHVISVKHERIVMNTKDCIRCFCCQETCPEGSISAKRKPLGKIVAKLLFRD